MEITLLTVEGRSALAEGDGPRSLDILSRKHEMVLAAFGSKAGPTGTSLVDLAEALHLVGRQKDARKAIEEALTIFKRLDRRDEMRDRLEQTLIEICRRQGHSFIVEELLRARVLRKDEASSEDELRRAVDQDELAMQLFRQRRYDQALPLFMDSKDIFERAGETAEADLAICCQFIARVHLHTEQFDEAVAYGRKAVDCARRAYGDESLEVTMAMDELAVALAFQAQRGNDSELARESIALSESALQQFTAMQGASGKEAARSGENNRRLRQMLQPLIPAAGEGLRQPDLPAVPALPTYSFISHSYADAKALDVLLKSLPDYVKPVVFEAINAPPTDFVSDKLISGLLDAEGFIFIDSHTSNSSYWCAFERDLAARKRKHMFRFDPRTRTFERLQANPRELKLAHCFHPSDGADVQRVIRWLVDERSFAAFHDEQKFGDQSFPPFASLTDSERDMRLFSLRTFGTLYLLFLSENLLTDEPLRRHVVDQLHHHPRATLVCWLRPQPADLPRDLKDALRRFPREHGISFSRRPTEPGFDVHALDDLGVRLFWVHHQIRGGDWTL